MKNLSNFKIIIKTREYLIQAIYQMLFSNDNIQKIITQFKEEHKDKKVDFIKFSDSLESIDKNKKEIESVIKSADISSSSIELIDKSILIFAINEMFYGTLDKPIIIDESIRLAKKFSSPDSYKFLNATLDKILKKGI
tara:strand:+ start:168 stop:581 length:414 start_codon:yes stop_codon:yes gene_type:complete